MKNKNCPKAKIVWIKKRYWNEGELVDILDPRDFEVSFTEPDYDEDLYDKYVLIPLEND